MGFILYVRLIRVFHKNAYLRSLSARPLRIITGRGSHSTNRVGVLGPAVRKTLSGDGWNGGAWSAGLTVNGRG